MRCHLLSHEWIIKAFLQVHRPTTITNNTERKLLRWNDLLGNISSKVKGSAEVRHNWNSSDRKNWKLFTCPKTSRNDCSDNEWKFYLFCRTLVVHHHSPSTHRKLNFTCESDPKPEYHHYRHHHVVCVFHLIFCQYACYLCLGESVRVENN